jgi:hypothetical protein
MDEQLSFEEAKRLSIIKWEATINQGGNLYKIPRGIRKLKHYCGFCERYKVVSNENLGEDCDRCEFGKVAGKCVLDNSLFDDWYTSRYEDRTHKAKIILECIKSLKENS